MEFFKRWKAPTPEKRREQEAQKIPVAIDFIESTKKLMQAAHDAGLPKAPTFDDEAAHQKRMASLEATIAELKEKLPPAS